MQKLSTQTIIKPQLSDLDLYQLAWTYTAGEAMREKISELTPILEQLDSKFFASFYSMSHEYRNTLELSRVILERETKHIIPERQGHYQKSWEFILKVLRNI